MEKSLSYRCDIMKKKVAIIPGAIVLGLLAVLFVPIPRGPYDDGGTRVYDAIAHKIVVWNRAIAQIENDCLYVGELGYGDMLR